MCTTGHNSYKGCRFCYIEGVYANRHVYYPLKPPNNRSTMQYNPGALPKRSHTTYERDVAAVMSAVGTAARNKEKKNRGMGISSDFRKRAGRCPKFNISFAGINGHSILFELRSISFPDSFPVDVMHCLFENVVPAMFRHWNGTFFKDGLSQTECTLPPSTWQAIGEVMERNRENMPTDFGRAPIDIHRHASGFKAEQWLSWILCYTRCHFSTITFRKGIYVVESSRKLMDNNIIFLSFSRIVKGWAKFVKVTKLCLEWEITDREVEEIKKLFRDFCCALRKVCMRTVTLVCSSSQASRVTIGARFREYIHRDSERLSAALMSFHYVLHIADSIRNTGPAWATWQFPMERLCGMLLPLVRSRQHLYVNL